MKADPKSEEKHEKNTTFYRTYHIHFLLIIYHIDTRSISIFMPWLEISGCTVHVKISVCTKFLKVGARHAPNNRNIHPFLK